MSTYQKEWSDYSSEFKPIEVAANEGDTGEYWSTYYNEDSNIKAPDGTKVFKAALDGTTMTLTEIADGIITKGQGVSPFFADLFSRLINYP